MTSSGSDSSVAVKARVRVCIEKHCIRSTQARASWIGMNISRSHIQVLVSTGCEARSNMACESANVVRRKMISEEFMIACGKVAEVDLVY